MGFFVREDLKNPSVLSFEHIEHRVLALEKRRTAFCVIYRPLLVNYKFFLENLKISCSK